MLTRFEILGRRVKLIQVRRMAHRPISKRVSRQSAKMRHLSFLSKEHFSSCDQGKSLLQKATGRFYTPELIGTHLVHAALRALKAIKPLRRGLTCRVIDPFCGDGRLVRWLLEKASSEYASSQCHWNLDLWDCDPKSVHTAKQAVKETGQKLGLKVSVNARCCDTFFVAPEQWGEFDVVLTNPPWEVLKPDRRELTNLKKKETAQYIERLRDRSEALNRIYPLSRPKVKFSGWGTNLARCGTEVAFRLVSRSGIVGVVSPASLLADQVSESLRRWLFTTHSFFDLAYYPAEARLFSQVDQPCITVVGSPRSKDRSILSTLTVYDSSAQGQSQPFTPFGRQAESSTFVLPLHFGLAGIELLSKFKSLPTFQSLEGKGRGALWAGRELDETGHMRFLTQAGDYMFIKGRMIRRFGIVEEPSKYVSRNGPPVPTSANNWRIAWRDVSRPSQKRRMHATLLPPGWVSGNSLNVAYFRDDDLDRLKALLALMNSLVFEFQVRATLATAHISLGAVRKARIPILNNRKLVTKLSRLSDLCLRRNGEAPQAALEATVARAYDLSKTDLSFLLSCFDKLDNDERKAILQASE
jgi:Alw26I/Eco31I/Esp3I family type II restriction m6 adenine DNA methyltransferase